jgi:hypothetical protein
VFGEVNRSSHRSMVMEEVLGLLPHEIEIERINPCRKTES